MARTVNLLSDGDALLRKTTTGNVVALSSLNYGWTTTGSTLEIVASDYVVDTRYTIQLNPSASAVTLTLDPIQLKKSDNNRQLSANFKVKCASSVSIQASLYLVAEGLGSVTANQQTFTSGQYNALHTNTLLIPDDETAHTVGIHINVTNLSGVGFPGTIHVTLPHLIHDLGFFQNPVAISSRQFLPDLYWEYDSQDTNPTYPFFKLIDALSAEIGETWIERDRMYGPEVSQLETPAEKTDYWAQSTLVSPTAVREDYINWLGQLTGTRIRQNIQTADGSYYLDNDRLRRDFIEWQLSYSHLGRAAGTREAMFEAVKRVLIKTIDGEPSTLSVAITPRYLGDPFALRVQTLTNETYDASVNESSNLVLQMAELSRPMGYTVVHNTVDEFFFTLDDPTLGILDNFRFG